MADEQVFATSADANAQLAYIIKNLSMRLIEPHPLNMQHKTPSGFDDALDKISSDNISQIFATKGFWSWLAYFFADEDTHQDLSTLPSDAISHIAGNVSKAEVDAALVKRVQHILCDSSRARSRRTKLVQSGVKDVPFLPALDRATPASIPPSPTHTSRPNPPKRRRDDSWSNLVQSTNEALGTILQQNDSNTIPQSDTAQINAELELFGNPNLPPFAIDRQRSYAYPDASKLPIIFENDLGSAIVRYGLKAAVLLGFEDDPVDCKVIVEIQSSDAAWLAMNFYGVHVREQSQQRAVIHQGATSLEIIGTLRFQETDPQIWDKFLGSVLSIGVNHSLKRQKEQERGFTLSRCLTLEVPGAADLPCRLTMVVGTDTARMILHNLWQK